MNDPCVLLVPRWLHFLQICRILLYYLDNVLVLSNRFGWSVCCLLTRANSVVDYRIPVVMPLALYLLVGLF